MDEGGGSLNSTATATATGTEPSYPSNSIFSNYPLLSALFAFAIAQLLKVFSTWYKENNWDFKQLVGSGGMPSSHSATVSALAEAIGFQQGFGGSQFGLVLILALVVMYDATGVRLHTWRQAEVLNQIIYELPSEHPLAESRPLRELLGHTPPQVVAGAMLGLVTAATGHFLFNSGTPSLMILECNLFWSSPRG